MRPMLRPSAYSYTLCRLNVMYFVMTPPRRIALNATAFLQHLNVRMIPAHMHMSVMSATAGPTSTGTRDSNPGSTLPRPKERSWIR